MEVLYILGLLFAAALIIAAIFAILSEDKSNQGIAGGILDFFILQQLFELLGEVLKALFSAMDRSD